MTTITLDTPTPFAATVRTNRSRSKAEKGTPLTVVKVLDGNYGPYAICIKDDGEKVFLSLTNLVHEGPADTDKLAAIEAATAAVRDHGNRRVEIGEPSWSNSRCIAVDWTAEFVIDPTLARTRGGTKRVRLFFPKSKRDGTPLFDDGTVPGWLFDAKVREAREQLPQGFDLTERW